MANKNLTLAKVKKEAKKVHEKEVYEFEDGSTVTFYPFFAKTEIDKLYENLQSAILTNKETVEAMSNKMMQHFVMFHMIKQFTHFNTQLKATSIDEQLIEMEALIDAEMDGKSLFKFILDELFLPDQVAKVFDGLAEFTAMTQYMQDFSQKVKDNYEKLDLRSKKILEAKQQLKK